ncbi:Imitation switch two complex protein 1 [Cyberlindnera fabianii]|uniref:Imitation switch two complex protein 1 n=1 Tax=Cyberlindnera fabianii TaxID=36022 RepID=A0A1V2L7I6_CYBFA|nr:Imitation switch two complex protein 1 [Cyberlindnera fabianii]
MVLFKRKPVNYPDPPPLPENTNVRCWFIPVTKEWFLDYNDYLKRMDYYRTRKFVCEITGNSCLTYFEAYESEVKEMRLVEKFFPEHLKEPILRHIQFSVVPRIDQLVDEVYSAFKNDYYPGETVVVRLNDFRNDFKTRCIIREKAKFNAIYGEDGSVFRPAYAQYRVSRLDDNSEVVVDESQVTRDRNNFTKWFVKAFIKLCVTRSAKIGAPWIVKKKYADRYRIPTELPPELAHFKEETKGKKRKLVDLRPKGEGDASNGARGGTPDKTRGKGANIWRKILSVPPSKGSPGIPTPPPPVKRVIQEDLTNPFELSVQKPLPHKMEELGEFVPDALESWSFLNVYRVPLLLDTFTFDDFLTAMKWSIHHRCTLQDEIFCAVLSGFCKVGAKELEFEFPEEFDEDSAPIKDDSDDDIFDDGLDAKKKDSGEGDKSDVKDEDDKDKVIDIPDSSDDSFYDEDTNKVEQYLNHRGQSYVDRLSKRLFKDGGWQIIMLGILYEVSHFKGWKEHIKEIFDRLAPLESSVNNAALLSHFQNLDAGLKIKALNILCTLLVNSPLIRTYLEKCMEESTSLRRDRLEKLRDYKVAYENAQNADKELRIIIDTLKANGANQDTPALTEEQIADAKKKTRRRGDLNLEPTEEELGYAKDNEELAVHLATRTAQLKIAQDLRAQRREKEGEEKVDDQADKTSDENATQDEIKPVLSTKLPPKFIKLAEQVFAIKFDQDDKKIKSAADGRTLVDEYGATIAGLTPEQRKVIEEHPDPLFTALDWRYYDKVDEIERLIKWLDPWGKRESKLIKELNAVKDQITSSIEARRKALRLDTKTPEEIELEKTIAEIVISDTEPESEYDDDDEEDDDDDDDDGEDDDESSVSESPDESRRATRRSIAQAEKAAEEKRKREEQLREKIAEKEARRLKSRPAARIARRQEKKRKAKEHKRKRALLEESQEKLEKIREDLEMEHCLDWVNSAAQETLGYSHYEGPKKTRGRPTRK